MHVRNRRRFPDQPEGFYFQDGLLSKVPERHNIGHICRARRNNHLVNYDRACGQTQDTQVLDDKRMERQLDYSSTYALVTGFKKPNIASC
jgi:hypothetical protein